MPLARFEPILIENLRMERGVNIVQNYDKFSHTHTMYVIMYIAVNQIEFRLIYRKSRSGRPLYLTK